MMYCYKGLPRGRAGRSCHSLRPRDRGVSVFSSGGGDDLVEAGWRIMCLSPEGICFWNAAVVLSALRIGGY